MQNILSKYIKKKTKNYQQSKKQKQIIQKKKKNVEIQYMKKKRNKIQNNKNIRKNTMVNKTYNQGYNDKDKKIANKSKQTVLQKAKIKNKNIKQIKIK